MKIKTTFFLLIWANLVLAFPSPPIDSDHPGYPRRGSSFEKIEINKLRKGSFLFLPTKGDGPFPMVVFAHGQALGLKNYEILFERFANMGIAVLYPKYDKGFFDTDWQRMGQDYDDIVLEVLSNYPKLDEGNVVYSGHSKGGYVGLMALGHRGKTGSPWWPKTSVFYSPAGFDPDYLSLIDKSHDVHLVWPKDDSIIKEQLIDEIYSKLPSLKKQKILVQGYSDFEAGHFFPLTKSSLFGGSNGVGPLHYYGVIPWTVGAIEKSGYLYGEEASDSGGGAEPHIINRSWSLR